MILEFMILLNVQVKEKKLDYSNNVNNAKENLDLCGKKSVMFRLV